MFFKNITRFCSGLLVVLVILISLYVYTDPFKVVKHYENYYLERGIELNRDFVSTQTYIQNSQDFKYNSFIFGNSRSIVYQVEDWKEFIGNDAVCFHFNAYGESLYAMAKKISFIDERKDSIKNAILVIDYSLLSDTTEKEGHLYRIAPKLIDNKSVIQFHWSNFQAFISNPKFMFISLDYKLNKEIKPYMSRANIIRNKPISYQLKYNELGREYDESLILKDEYYTPQIMELFNERTDNTIENISERCILDNQIKILQDIESVFRKHQTSFKIIINPLYDQKKLNPEDLKELIKIFGDENIYDFSGVNEFTDSYLNYYEPSHYRATIAKEILEIIYNDK